MNIEKMKFREMNQSDYNRFNNRAKGEPMSEYAKFHSALNGYDLFRGEAKVDKWEVYASGYRNATLILSGKSAITAVLRPVKEDESLGFKN